MMANCDVVVFRLVRDRELDEIIARSWLSPNEAGFQPKLRRGYDIEAIYSQLASNHERAELLNRAGTVQPSVRRKDLWLKRMPVDRPSFPATSDILGEQNEALLDRWHELPRRVQDQVWMHLRHYLHSVLAVSWLVDSAPARSALTSLSWRRQPMSLSVKQPVGDVTSQSPISDTVRKLLDRLATAIAELGYEDVLEDLLSPDLVGGEDSLLPSQEIMVIPGHLNDISRPILLAVSKGWNGKEPLTFCRVMRQVKARLIEARGTIKAVVVICDCWDSARFQEEHSEELKAHAHTGVSFLFALVGVPGRSLIPLPMAFDLVPR
jgi:hypothetical protein